ncbi:MAG TPA: tandem-95 repeat protein, partial [Luteolibacter sp.]
VWDISKLSVNGTLGVRARPVALADLASMMEDQVISVAVLANDSDADGDTLAIQSVTQGAHGSVAIVGTSVIYTPAANWNGSDTFTYTITDNREGPAVGTVSVTVNSVNDAPVFASNPINKPAANEDAAYSGTLAGSANDVDAGDTLTYSKLNGGPAWLTVAPNGALSGTPTNSDVGNNSFTVRVTDSTGAIATAILNITVGDVNDAPVFTVNPINGIDANAGVAYGGTLAGTATDMDASDTLSYSKVNGPAWLSVAADGSLSGTPAVSDSGSTNHFTVQITDTGELSSQATLNISVRVMSGNGTWTNANGGTWTSAGNWNGGLIAGGVDKAADFSTLNLTADASVTLDGASTVGLLMFGDTTPSNNWALSPGNGGSLTLAVSTGSPSIHVVNQSATISAVLAGSQGLQKNGSGGLALAGANTYVGVTTVNAGTLSVGGDQSAATGGWMINGGTTANFLSGSTVAVASGNSVYLANDNTAHALMVAGSVTNEGALSLSAGSTVTLNAGAQWSQSGTMTVQPLNAYT